MIVNGTEFPDDATPQEISDFFAAESRPTTPKIDPATGAPISQYSGPDIPGGMSVPWYQDPIEYLGMLATGPGRAVTRGTLKIPGMIGRSAARTFAGNAAKAAPETMTDIMTKGAPKAAIRSAATVARQARSIVHFLFHAHDVANSAAPKAAKAVADAVLDGLERRLASAAPQAAESVAPSAVRSAATEVAAEAPEAAAKTGPTRLTRAARRSQAMRGKSGAALERQAVQHARMRAGLGVGTGTEMPPEAGPLADPLETLSQRVARYPQGTPVRDMVERLLLERMSNQ